MAHKVGICGEGEHIRYRAGKHSMASRFPVSLWGHRNSSEILDLSDLL